MTMHLVDTRNNILAIAIEPVTGAIRMSDERIEPPKPLINSRSCETVAKDDRTVGR